MVVVLAVVEVSDVSGVIGVNVDVGDDGGGAHVPSMVPIACVAWDMTVMGGRACHEDDDDGGKGDDVED